MSINLELNLAPGSYKLWVEGVNSMGKGPYSPRKGVEVTVGALPPGTVTVIAPSGQDTNNPLIEWTEDSNGHADKYSILLRDAGNRVIHNKIHERNTIDQNGNVLTIDLGLSLAPGNYKVWVRGVNANGKGPYSPRKDFSVSNQSTPPGTVTVISPAGQTSNSSLFEWTEDSNASATSYSILVRDEANGVVHNKEYALAALNQTGNVFNIELNLNLVLGSYKLWVRGVNANDKGLYCPRKDFVITSN